MTQRLIVIGLGHGPRTKRNTKSNDGSVVCRTFTKKTNALDTNEIDIGGDGGVDGGSNVYDECFEYKQFGTDLFNVYFNKSIIANHDKRRLADDFVSKYKVGGLILGERIYLGEIALSKNLTKSTLNINIFGSEHLDLDLCDVKDKVFVEYNSIPLYNGNIWFMTDVGFKIRYKLAFQFKVPQLICTKQNNSNAYSHLFSKLSADHLLIDQNTTVELGAVFDASFLVSEF